MRRTPRHPAAVDLPSWWLVRAASVPAEHELHRVVAAALAAPALAATSARELVTTLDLLIEIGADPDTQAAALAAQTGLPQSGLSPTVAQLSAGVADAEKVWALHSAHGVSGSAEGLRRLLLAIVRDLRVVFVLLAQMLARLRHAESREPPARVALARLAMDLHAPLANRLGIWQLKWEIEDLAFRYAEADTYRRVAKLLDERRSDRESYIVRTTAALRQELVRAGIEAEIKGRPKHIYSIWKKLQRKGGDFEQLYDLRALRELVGNVADCYATLGLVHALWPPVPAEFDDYIARPKGNHYQSLHTAVQGPDGRALEIQIRTHEMHAHAELGVAAHWRYKEGGGGGAGGDAAFDRRIAWMRQLLDARGGAEDASAEESGSLIAALDSELRDERVYLLTPRGEVLDLAHGATVLDFAYAVHTEVGHRCRGAKVDGRIVPLTHQPRSGDTVEIMTAKQGEPKRDWLIAERGYLNTARARDKARAWFRRIDTDRNLAAGRDLLEREF
ncbi:MAG: TGS domain-containing protein, partial [Lysobacterales bacterium]